MLACDEVKQVQNYTNFILLIFVIGNPEKFKCLSDCRRIQILLLLLCHGVDVSNDLLVEMLVSCLAVCELDKVGFCRELRNCELIIVL